MKGRNLHRKFPNGQLSSSIRAAPNGTLKSAMRRSEMVRLIMKQLVVLCIVRLVMIMWHTIRFEKSEMTNMME